MGSVLNPFWPISCHRTLAPTERDEEALHVLLCTGMPHVCSMLPWIRRKRQEEGEGAKNRQCLLEETNPGRAQSTHILGDQVEEERLSLYKSVSSDFSIMGSE